MTPAFVGFIVVALVWRRGDGLGVFGARKNWLTSAWVSLWKRVADRAIVAPVLVSSAIGPTPMDLQFWPGAVVMMSPRCDRVDGTRGARLVRQVLVLMVYLIRHDAPPAALSVLTWRILFTVEVEPDRARVRGSFGSS